MYNFKSFILTLSFLAIASTFSFGTSVTPQSQPQAVEIEVLEDCDLTIGQTFALLYEASNRANMPFFVSAVRFIFGINTIECIPGGFQVALLSMNPDHGFIIIDILEDF